MQSNGMKKPTIVIRLSHMGDVALTTGVLAHRHDTHCETFVFITRSANAPLLENHPAIAETITLSDTDLTTAKWIRRARELAKRYRDHTLLDLHGTLRSRILSVVWNGPVKRYPKYGLYRRLFDRTHMDVFKEKLESTSVPQRYAMALDQTPPAAQDITPRIYLTQEEKEAAVKTLPRTDRPLVALHPYATHTAKQWPVSHWTELTELLSTAGMDWFVVGRNDTQLFPGDPRDFTNATNLRATCGLLRQADMLVTGDSGPMHLASGVGTPVTAIFGPTVKAWGFFPAGVEDQVLERDMDCRPCSLHGGKSCEKGHECMAAISPADVMESLKQRIKR